MQISDRSSHQFFNSSKEQTRINNINIVKQTNLIEDNRLICSWCELMGTSGIETLNLLESQNLLNPNGFIGVDLDENIINNFKLQKPNYQWYAGNIFNVANNLQDVGVLNLDLYGNIDCKEIKYMAPIKRMIQKSIHKFGEFVLFYNKDIDSVVRQQKDKIQSLRSHTEAICKSFDNFLPNRKLDPYQILPKNYEYKLENNFVGTLGAYEIYKGKKNGHRMCNLHLIFR